MLQKLIITAQCVKAGSTKGYGGIDIHGWFFNWLHTYDPLLSQKLHDLEDKPFSIGSLAGAKREQGQTHLIIDKEYSFSIAGLNTEVCNLLNEMVNLLPSADLRLGSAVLKIKEVLPLFRGQGLSYQEILGKTKTGTRFRMEFRSPTGFRKNGNQIVFPQPELIMQNLWRRWNIFSKNTLPEIKDDFSFIQVSRYKLQTQLLDFGDYKIIGFMGECAFQMDKKLPEAINALIHSLGFFAGIAGVGYKTSMGLGDTRYYSS